MVATDRPLERRTAARTAVIWDALAPLLSADQAGGMHVLDIGGGTGTMSVRVAKMGHRVTVVDPSPDALAALDRRAHESNVAEQVTGIQADLADLPSLLGDTIVGPVDLVLCHGLLGLLSDHAQALRTIGSALRPGGHLSLVVGQRHAAVLARAMAGHFAQAHALLDGDEADGAEHRFSVKEIGDLLAATDFEVAAVHAVRVFADLVPASLLDLEPGAHAALLELERAVADRPDYAAMATQLHLLATR